MYSQDPLVEKNKSADAEKLTFSTTVTAKVESELVLVQKDLLATINSLASKEKNAGSLKMKGRFHSPELDALKLWIPQAKELEGLNQLAKYLKVLLDPKKHMLLAARVSSDESARTNIDKAHEVVSDYFKAKVRTAKEMQTLKPNDVDARIDRLNIGLRATLSNFVQ